MMVARVIDADLLRALRLPTPEEGSKEERGRVCIIGGSREVPGAVILAALGAMRAGAGKLKIISVESRAAALATAMPEALVIDLPETPAGGMQSQALASITSRWAGSHSILVGPGMVEEADSHEILKCLLACDHEATILVDAGALPRIMELGPSLRIRAGRVIITPHAGEMANLLNVDKAVVEADPAGVARELTQEFGLVVVSKGSQTVISAPNGIWRYDGGGVGLATSGSGDVLAGVIAGLAARGAEPAIAAIWGVFLHGGAGLSLAKTVGSLGFLAREIPDCIPNLMSNLQ